MESGGDIVPVPHGFVAPLRVVPGAAAPAEEIAAGCADFRAPKVSIRPIEKMSVDLVYQYLRAPEATGSGTGKNRGQNPQFVLRYNFTDWLSGHLWGEYFMPGNFHAGDDDGFFARWELLARF